MEKVNDNLWSILYDSVSTNIGLANDDFQLISPFQIWNWETASPGFTNAGQQSFLDSKPEFSPVGSYRSGDSFSRAYRNYLNSLRTEISPELANQLTIDTNNLFELTNRFDTEVNAALAAYAAANPTNEPTFDEWLQTFGGISYGTRLNTLKTQIEEQQLIVNEITAQTGDKNLREARADYQDPQFDTKVLTSSTAQPVDAKAYLQIDSFSKWITQNGQGPSMSFEVKSSNTSNAVTTSFAGANVTIRKPFWETQVGGKFSSLEKLMQRNDVTLELSFASVGRVPIRNAGWFNESIVIGRGTDPKSYLPGIIPKDDGSGKKHVFGEGGILPARLTEMLVGLNPKFTVKTTGKFSKETMERFTAANRVRIGPFRFGGEAHKESKIKDLIVSDNEISGSSDSVFPVIFGTILKVYG